MKRLVPFLLVTALGAPAFAQEGSRAQALFDEGRRLMRDGRYAEACPKLAASQKLDPGAGTLMNLATCYEKNGQLASAWSTFLEAASAARSANHPEWETAARGRAVWLEPEIPRLVVVVQSKDVPGLVIERDGQPMDPAEWGSSMPIDSGKHTLRAQAPGKKPWSSEIKIAGPRTQITIPALEDESSTAKSESPAGASEDSGSTQRLLGVIAGGAGVISVGVGAFFGVKAGSTNDDALTHCNAVRQCDARGLDLRDTATSQAGVSTGFFVAGVALLAAGAVLYFTAPKRVSTGALQLGGSF
jgi:hypothetical protein